MLIKLGEYVSGLASVGRDAPIDKVAVGADSHDPLRNGHGMDDAVGVTHLEEAAIFRRAAENPASGGFSRRIPISALATQAS